VLPEEKSANLKIAIVGSGAIHYQQSHSAAHKSYEL
jgi:hypothetical protein